MDQAVDQYNGLDLMDGERIDRSISAAPQSGRSSSSGDDSLLLTNSRIIRISGTGGGTEVVMASVDDVDSVEFIMINEGYGAFIWAGLSVILSIALFSILENQITRVIVPLMVLGMGVFLIVNRLFNSGGPAAVFRFGGSAITWPFESEDESLEIRDFISGLYRMKSARRPETGWPFAPR